MTMVSSGTCAQSAPTNESTAAGIPIKKQQLPSIHLPRFRPSRSPELEVDGWVVFFFVAGAQTHRYWPRGVALSPHSGPKRFADGRRHAYCSGTDKKRISNSGRLPGSSREPSPEALELSLVAPRTPGACPWGPWAPGGDSSRASGEGSREDPGSRPDLEIRFLSVPER